MPIEIKMPALSPTMEVGTLARWLVKEGDNVAPGDVIAEIETDKATMEVEAVDEGQVAKILVADGTEEVKVGHVIALLAEEGEDAAAVGKQGAAGKAKGNGGTAPPAAAEPKVEAEVKGYGAQPKADAAVARAAPEKATAEAVPPAHSGQERVKASPLARRLAQAKGIDLAAMQGSGPGGRIVKADLEKASQAKQPAAPVEAPAAREVAAQAEALPGDLPYETVKLSNMRKVIARRLTESKQTVPHFYLTVDMRLDALLKLRSELNAALADRGVKLSVNDLLVKAMGVALIKVPDANVQFAGDKLLKFGRADISVAVAIAGGLITPVIKDAANKSLSVLATEMKDLAARARDGKLAPDEYQGGTASLSNLGMYGIKQFDAVINPPQGLIVAVGAGEKRAVVEGDQLGIATMMSATGSFDHRAIDGAVGAEFMAALKTTIEQPLAMLA